MKLPVSPDMVLSLVTGLCHWAYLQPCTSTIPGFQYQLSLLCACGETQQHSSSMHQQPGPSMPQIVPSQLLFLAPNIVCVCNWSLPQQSRV